jgi:hypothetical protein
LSLRRHGYVDGEEVAGSINPLEVVMAAATQEKLLVEGHGGADRGGRRRLRARSPAREFLEEEMEPAVMDAALIAAAQKVEHYEIASYGSARTWGQAVDPASSSVNQRAA